MLSVWCRGGDRRLEIPAGIHKCCGCKESPEDGGLGGSCESLKWASCLGVTIDYMALLLLNEVGDNMVDISFFCFNLESAFKV